MLAKGLYVSQRPVDVFTSGLCVNLRPLRQPKAYVLTLGIFVSPRSICLPKAYVFDQNPCVSSMPMC